MGVPGLCLSPPSGRPWSRELLRFFRHVSNNVQYKNYKLAHTWFTTSGLSVQSLYTLRNKSGVCINAYEVPVKESVEVRNTIRTYHVHNKKATLRN
jgi:hypothetical protein